MQDFTAHLTDEERALLIRALDGRLVALREMYRITENHRFKIEHARTKALLERINATGTDRFARFDPAPRRSSAALDQRAGSS